MTGLEMAIRQPTPMLCEGSKLPASDADSQSVRAKVVQTVLVEVTRHVYSNASISVSWQRTDARNEIERLQAAVSAWRDVFKRHGVSQADIEAPATCDACRQFSPHRTAATHFLSVIL
jgi:cell wall assembly regulator SMI1